MTKTIDNLCQDLEKLFEGSDITSRIQQFSDKLGAEIVVRFAEYADEKPQTLRMSNVGQPLRKLWYTLKGYKGDKLDAFTKTKFLYGTILEELFIHLIVESGHEVTCLQEEVEVNGVKGHLDLICDGVLLDVKSASSFSYKKFLNGDLYKDDPFGYVAQLTGYKQALGLERAGWLVIDKTTGHFAFVELKENIIYDLTRQIQTIRQSLESDTEPTRCYADKANDKQGNRILDVGCQFCGFKKQCWKDSNDGKGLLERSYSTGIRYFTVLQKEPRLKESYEVSDFNTEEFNIKSLA